MIGILVRVMLFIVIVVVIYRLYKGIVSKWKQSVFGGVTQMAGREICPACRERIRVRREPGQCPQCGTPLGRSPGGDLLIRVN